MVSGTDRLALLCAMGRGAQRGHTAMQRAGRRARVAPSRFSPDEEHARPQLGGGLTGAVLARQVLLLLLLLLLAAELLFLMQMVVRNMHIW
eukprot:COSAG02_NODE_858_length_16456_cov_7.419698_9_plen_91_part_00